jgi:acylphosphatase
MGQLRATVRIRGQVQGVSFRYFTERAARSLGLTGWVRNLPGGDVEAVFEGPEEQINEILAACRRGPPTARVDGMDIARQEASGEFEGFTVRY